MKGHRCTVCFEPVWRPRRQLFHEPIPSHVAGWLFAPGSLTRRVQRACPGRFRVAVLSQRWERPTLNESRRLGLRGGERALVRQVHLLCDEQPWVFARTVLPRRTLSGAQRRLACLGSRPLGAVLFADRSMRRDEVEVSRIGREQRLHQAAFHYTAHASTPIWGRRSVFRVRHKALLVCEVFLPGIAPCPPG